MGEHSYIAHSVPQASCMPGSLTLVEGQRMSIEPPGSAYQDPTSYSTSTSFTLSAPCDPSLLTPISTAASPPLHQNTKFGRQYQHSEPPQQVLTPPESSNMYPFPSQFEMSGPSSQTSSPMVQPAPAPGEFVESSYVVESGRRSPNEQGNMFFGNYGVSSDPSQHHGLQAGGGPFYIMPSQQIMRDDPNMPLDARGHPSPSSLVGAHIKTERRRSDDILPYTRASTRASARSPRNQSSRPANRVRSKRGSNARKSVQTRTAPAHIPNPVGEFKNCHGEEVEPMVKESCPAEERCIFESRWRHRHQKGQDMWDSIQNDYVANFTSTHNKEMLQMKYRRGRAKYYQWLADDERILRAAWESVEKERYQKILERFHELGGSRNMNLSPSDIEVKLVTDLKLEEDVYLPAYPTVNIRRRRKLSNKASAAGGRGFEDHEMHDMGHNTRSEDEVINQAYGLTHLPQQWEHGPSMTPDSMDLQMVESQHIKMEPGVARSSGQVHGHVASQALYPRKRGQ